MKLSLFKKGIISFLILALLAGCSPKSEKVTKNSSSDKLYIRKVENLTNDFIMGMDSSSVISLENAGLKYYNYDGNEEDVFKILAENGINYIRVRIWNDPYDAYGNSYGGGNCNINNAIEIGKRATKYGMKLLVDFHYSDFWADPGKQMCPKDWQNMSIEEKDKALYDFTRDCLKKLKAAKVDVGMVQIGNETNGAMASETTWMNIIYHLMASGSKAVREVYPKALVAVHFANPENSEAYADYAKKLDYYQLDYDVFASSYYPYWHGTLENISTTLSAIAEKYNKKVMVVETSYANTAEDFDYFGNTISNESAVAKNYPYTLQGQTNCIVDVIDTVANKMKNGIGVCYWEGTWLPVQAGSYDANKEIWQKYGCGWASSYAKEYDSEDAGKYYGGTAVDNQLFFDKNGKVLESLKLFELVKTGNLIPQKADAIEDANIMMNINDIQQLPETVTAIMNDGSTKTIPVIWDNVDYTALKENGIKKYTINGNADGLKATCYLSMIEYNYVNNFSFEDDANKQLTPKNWQIVENTKADQVYVEEKQTDSLSGNKHFHFWSKNHDTVNFDLMQTIDDLPDGNYHFSISIMGGDCGKTNIYQYVMINGKIIERTNKAISGYGNWDQSFTETFYYDGTSEIKIGIHVECTGEGNGAWGKIDDAILNSIKG